MHVHILIINIFINNQQIEDNYVIPGMAIANRNNKDE